MRREKMKILVIRTFPDKLKLNNYNVQEVGLAKALVKKGHECDIVLYNGKEKDKVENYCFFEGGKEYRFKIYWLRGFNILKNGFMPGVKKLLPQYDVVQVHEYEQILSWYLYTKQIKPTVIYHGPYYDKFAKGYNLKCRIFDKCFLPMKQYKDVIAISKSALATEFLQKKGFQNVTTVGVGVNFENFHHNQPVSNKFDNKTTCKKLLYIGKIEERRNPYFLVEVFKKLQKEIPGIQLTIIGNGEKEYKDRFLDHIKAEIERNEIIYYKQATQEELVKYYCEAAFFLLPSYYEIFGMVLLEAMYFGLPVISSINGGSSTLIKDGYNGFVMKHFDSNEWVDCILNTMRDNDKMKGIGKNARKTVEEGYTWNALAGQFIMLYRKALCEKMKD